MSRSGLWPFGRKVGAACRLVLARAFAARSEVAFDPAPPKRPRSPAALWGLGLEFWGCLARIPEGLKVKKEQYYSHFFGQDSQRGRPI